MTAATPDAAGVLAELRRWIGASWDPELSLVHWRERLADAGWACPAWPRGWCGRSLSAGLAALVTEELAGAGVPGPAEGSAWGWPGRCSSSTAPMRSGNFLCTTTAGRPADSIACMAMTSSAIDQSGIRDNGRHLGVALLVIATAQLMVVLDRTIRLV